MAAALSWPIASPASLASFSRIWSGVRVDVGMSKYSPCALKSASENFQKSSGATRATCARAVNSVTGPFHPGLISPQHGCKNKVQYGAAPEGAAGFCQFDSEKRLAEPDPELDMGTLQQITRHLGKPLTARLASCTRVELACQGWTWFRKMTLTFPAYLPPAAKRGRSTLSIASDSFAEKGQT